MLRFNKERVLLLGRLLLLYFPIMSAMNGKDWKKAFKDNLIVPDVVHQLPKSLLQVDFGSGPIRTGEVISLSSIRGAPHLTWDVKDGELYSVFIVNPDVPNRRTPLEAEWQHMAIFNLESTNIHKGNTTVEYSSEYKHRRKKGLQRIVVLVFKQKEGIDTSDMIKWNSTSHRSPDGNSRGNFHVKTFSKAQGFSKAVAGNFFYVTESSGANQKDGQESSLTDCKTLSDCKQNYFCLKKKCVKKHQKTPSGFAEPDEESISSDGTKHLRSLRLKNTVDNQVKDLRNFLGQYKYPSLCRQATLGDCSYLARWFSTNESEEILFVIQTRDRELTGIGFNNRNTLSGSDFVLAKKSNNDILDSHITRSKEIKQDKDDDLSDKSSQLRDIVWEIRFKRRLESKHKEGDVNLSDPKGVFIFVPRFVRSEDTLHSKDVIFSHVPYNFKFVYKKNLIKKSAGQDPRAPDQEEDNKSSPELEESSIDTEKPSPNEFSGNDNDEEKMEGSSEGLGRRAAEELYEESSMEEEPEGSTHNDLEDENSAKEEIDEEKDSSSSENKPSEEGNTSNEKDKQASKSKEPLFPLDSGSVGLKEGNPKENESNENDRQTSKSEENLIPLDSGSGASKENESKENASKEASVPTEDDPSSGFSSFEDENNSDEGPEEEHSGESSEEISKPKPTLKYPDDITNTDYPLTQAKNHLMDVKKASQKNSTVDVDLGTTTPQSNDLPLKENDQVLDLEDFLGDNAHKEPRTGPPQENISSPRDDGDDRFIPLEEIHSNSKEDRLSKPSLEDSDESGEDIPPQEKGDNDLGSGDESTTDNNFKPPEIDANSGASSSHEALKPEGSGDDKELESNQESSTLPNSGEAPNEHTHTQELITKPPENSTGNVPIPASKGSQSKNNEKKDRHLDPNISQESSASLDERLDSETGSQESIKDSSEENDLKELRNARKGEVFSDAEKNQDHLSGTEGLYPSQTSPEEDTKGFNSNDVSNQNDSLEGKQRFSSSSSLGNKNEGTVSKLPLEIKVKGISIRIDQISNNEKTIDIIINNGQSVDIKSRHLGETNIPFKNLPDSSSSSPRIPSGPPLSDENKTSRSGSFESVDPEVTSDDNGQWYTSDQGEDPSLIPLSGNECFGQTRIHAHRQFFDYFLECRDGKYTLQRCPKYSMFWGGLECCVLIHRFPCRSNCLK